MNAHLKHVIKLDITIFMDDGIEITSLATQHTIWINGFLLGFRGHRASSYISSTSLHLSSHTYLVAHQHAIG